MDSEETPQKDSFHFRGKSHVGSHDLQPDFHIRWGYFFIFWKTQQEGLPLSPPWYLAI